MKITDIITEAEQPVNAGQEYQQMMNFVRANKLQGLAPEQQISVALFRELKKQQQKNAALDNELAAADERIDIATQRGEMYGKQLQKHQVELERERQEIDKQKAAVGQVDQQFTNTAKANQQQLATLASQLDAIKHKPGVDKSSISAIEKQITQLDKASIPMQKYRELEQAISKVQDTRRTDDAEIRDLVAQVKAAQSKEQSLSNTKADISQGLSNDIKASLARIDQISSEIDKFKEIDRKVKALEPLVTDVIAPKLDHLTSGDREHDEAIGNLEQTVSRLNTALSARQAILRGADPRAIAGKMVQQGHIKR